jgi:PTH1 family peptidyl-tRNA hydrolase
MPDMHLVVGLGNPGPRYRHNRHNIGFQCVDLYTHRNGIDLSRVQQRCVVGDGWVGSGTSRRKTLVAKPLTFMNASGEGVGPLARYYRIEPRRILVIHDDLDLESGVLRLRSSGGSGGQNGVKSIIRHLGTHDFPRIRVGIGRPPGRMDPADYVLHDFSAQEEELFGPLRERICDAIDCWLFDGIEIAMNRYNG